MTAPRALAAAFPRRLSTLPLILAALLLGTILLLDAAPAQAQSTPTVTLSADKNPVREGEQVIFTATLSSAPAADFSIPVTATLVTAESADLTGSGTIRVDFPAGNTTASFIIGTVEDTDHDDETFVVALGTLPSSVTAGATTSLTITIRDYDDALALVSNVGQTSDGALLHRALAPGGNLWHLAQQFTTGANTGGYTLTSIEFNMAEAVSAPANIRAELWSTDTNGDPDSKLASLAVPSTVGTGNVAFYAPANTTLAASTKYFAVLYATGATEGKWTRTSTNGEDSGAASGWSIDNSAHDRSPSATSWSDYTYELKIRVNGFPAAPAAGASVWSATLTPRSLGGGSAFGCANAAAGQDKCSAAATLTDDDFTYRGESYDIVTLRVNTAGELTFSLDKSLPAYAKRDLVLTAGSAEFPLAEIGGSGPAYVKASSGLSWPANTPVTLGLKQRTPTTVTLSAAPNPVTEGAETVVTATLSKAQASAVQMEATVTAGTAESGDYTTLASHPLSFSAGSTTASIRIQTNQDDDKDNETLIVTLGSVPSGVEPGETISLTITITDDDATALVSNIGQTAGGGGPFGTGFAVMAQDFTTGGASGGYTLSSIEAVLGNAATAAQRATIRAELWSAATGGGPDSKLADLTVPSTVAAGTVSFAAPPNTTLTANTTYHVVLYTVGDFSLRLGATISANEDQGVASGWSIGDKYWIYQEDTPSTAGGNWIEATFTTHGNLRIRVKGEAATPATPLWSATLTAKSTVNGDGCETGAGLAADSQCSDTDNLTDDDFTLGGNAWSVTGVLYRSAVNDMQLFFNRDVRTALDSYNFCVGSTAFAFSSATHPGFDEVARWPNTVGWPVGGTVSLSIVPSGSSCPTPPTDATLSALTAKTATSETGTYTALNFGTFSAANTSYAQNVPAATTHLKLTPTANDAGATIKVGSGTILTAVTSGTESSAIELSAGTNAIKVEVTARDGATKQTYNLAIHRKDSDNVNPPASPSGLTLTPGERKLDASWTAGAVTSGVNDAPTRYEIYWHESSAANPGWAGLHVFVVTGNPLPTAYEITQLTDGVQYTVYVRACNRGGCSPSPKQTATTGYQPPSTVTLSAASDTVSEGVRGPNNAAGLVIVTATLDVGYAAQHSCAVTPGSGSTAKVRPEGSSTSDWDWRLFAALVHFNAGATSATFNVEVQDDSAEESAETAIIDIDCTGGVTDSLTLTIEDNDGAPAATLWSATLNVADKTTTEAGCDNGKSGAECSTESVLTDDDFIVGSTTWSVTALLSQKVTGALSMKFNRDVRTALDDYSVCIGARDLPFANAAHTGGNTWAEWDGDAADQHWFAGRDPVLVRISEDCSVSYDADLSGLTAKQQTSETAVTGASLALSPAFSGATTAYTASVANNVTNVRLTPTVNDPDATVKVGPATDLYPVRSGADSRPLAVRNNGANSFKVVVTAPDGATMKTYTVTVFRAGSGNVPKVSLSALAEVNEGSSLTVEALLSGPLAGDVTIPLTLTPGTAEPGDYGTLASITIPAGQSSASGVIATTRDADTDDETFTVSLAASLPSSVTAGAQPSVRVTIRDLDGADTATPPEVTLSVGGNPVREGRGISVFVFLSKPMAGSVTIPITLTPGTAEPGDYGTLASVTVTGIASHPSLGYDGKPFAIGRISTSQDDDLDDETLTVALGTLPSSVTAGEPSSVTVVINDDDKGAGLPTVSLWASPNPVTEGETVTITARLPYNWLWSDSVTVPVLLNAGTAESGDYGALTPASITILRGQSSGTATVATAEDADYDDETFTVSLGPLPATLGPANTRTSVTVTIADDDDDPDAIPVYLQAVPDSAYVVQGGDVAEGGTVTLWADLRGGRTLTADVTIPLTVTNVTAEPGDYVPPASITIPANKSLAKITLRTNWDADGDDETFTVSLGRLPPSLKRGRPHGDGFYKNLSDTDTVIIRDRGSTSSDAIWSATLTPQANALGTDPGCSNIVAGANCNSRSVLTENEFEVGGAATGITLIRTTSTGSEMSVNFSTNVRTALAGYQFCVGDRGFPFSSAFSQNTVAAWAPSPALPFSVGVTVPLSIVPSGSSCSAGAAPPPNMLVTRSDGWLKVTWRAPDYISTGAIVRWRLKDADPNTAGDQPGAWVPENGVLLRSEQHAAKSATLPPWDCSNCVPLVPGKLYEVGLRLVTATGYSDWGLAGEGVPVSAWPLALSVDSGAIPHGGSVTVTARLGYPAATLMWLRFDTEGDDAAARWGPDCDWEHGATDIIGPGQTEATVKLCATAGVTMTVKARILGMDAEATPIRVRALGPNPPTAITLSADPQAVANGGPVTVTARLDRPTAPGLTVRLSINGLGAAWWDHCDPPRRYRGTWGGKMIEIPAGGQEATAELCVMWRDGPPLEIAAWSDAPRLQAKTLSLLEPASLVLRSLTVSSTDPAEGLPENAVELSDASNDYTFSVPRAVSSVTVKPAAAYETTSVKVNGSAVDDTTPSVDVPLDVGDNTIRVEVSAPAVPAVREYTLTVTRMDAAKQPKTQVLARPECEDETGPLCGIVLSAGSESVEFSPDFARDTTAYQATVPAGTTSVTLTPDYAEGTSVFAGSRNGGTTYTRPTRVRPSGTAVELALAPDGGATELWLMVSGSGGMTTYSIHVTAARPEPKTYSFSAASTAAEGANATLTVTLSEAAPTGGVALTVTAGYGGSSTATADDVGSIASPVTVAAGETALAITIPTVDDDVDEDDETFTVTVAATTSGWEKAGDGRDTATVTITDDDTAGVTVTPTTLSVAEDGSASYTVVLDSRPTADVTVTVTSGDDGAASVSPASHAFTPSGWNISQLFIVSGVADDDTDDESVTISHGAASSDANYHGIAVASVAVSVTDDTPEQQQTAEPVEIPGPVVGLLLEATTDSVTVSWQAPESGGPPDRYIVHIKNMDTGKGKDRKVAAGKTTTTFRNLKAGATYRVWVRAQNEAGKGERVHDRITLPDGAVQGGEDEQQQVARTFSVSAAASAAEGGNAALTITLSETAPTGGVAFTVTASYSGQTATAADVGSITSPVTVAEGDTTLDISIPTADDAVDEDDETFTVTVAATTSGWEKEGDGRDTATITITDDDTAGVTVTPTTLSVSEDGSATYTVVLDSRPTADVTVTPTSGDAGAAGVAPASHTFTPSDWNTPQTFTVSGVSDEDRDNEAVAISNSATSSDGKYGKYGGIAVDSVSVSVADDDTPPTYSITATASAAEGNDATLTITLSEAAPQGGVQFTVTAAYGGSADSADVGSATSPVTVTEGNDTLDIALPIADDDLDEDDETFTVTVAASTEGWEKEGDGKDTATVTITDDDTAGVTVSPTTLNVSEDGSGSYTVVLDSRPTADVTVTPTSGDNGAASFSPASHTFTPSDWNTPQTFTVSGVADEDRDNESVTVSHSATSGDGKYHGIAADSVSVSVSDTTPPPAQEPEPASCPEETEPPVPGQKEPFNVCVTPGDGTLTVTWTVAPREGFEDDEIRHALRWSQEPGVWANPRDPNAVGANDGISVAGGVYTYTITGLENGVATGVFVRSFTGGNYNEDSPESSKWVRLKGENTTPKAAG